MSDSQQLPEQLPGPLDSKPAKAGFVLIGTIALLAGAVQYSLASTLPTHLDAYALGPARAFDFANDLWVAWGLCVALLTQGGLAAYAGLTRTRLRSRKLLGAVSLVLGAWVLITVLNPPKLDLPLLAGAGLASLPIVLAIGALLFRSKNSLFR